jgi:hypothetical protein
MLRSSGRPDVQFPVHHLETRRRATAARRVVLARRDWRRLVGEPPLLAEGWPVDAMPVYRPRTRSIPASTRASCWRESVPTTFDSNDRSMVTICETFATESLGKPMLVAASTTLPGASPRRKLLVSGTQTIVLIRLRLKALPWTTTTGRRKPGPEPVGSGRSAHRTCPWATGATNQCARESALRQSS